MNYFFKKALHIVRRTMSIPIITIQPTSEKGYTQSIALLN